MADPEASGTTQQHFLTLTGFLQFYLTAIKTCPSAVWQDLRQHGYGDNLRKTRPEANVQAPPTPEPVPNLPLLTRGILSSEAFYEAAVLAAVVKVLERVQDAFKTDKDAKQADAALKAYIKKSAKKK